MVFAFAFAWVLWIEHSTYPDTCADGPADLDLAVAEPTTGLSVGTANWRYTAAARRRAAAVDSLLRPLCAVSPSVSSLGRFKARFGVSKVPVEMWRRAVLKIYKAVGIRYHSR